jgi:hypothetical protein
MKVGLDYTIEFEPPEEIIYAQYGDRRNTHDQQASPQRAVQ